MLKMIQSFIQSARLVIRFLGGCGTVLLTKPKASGGSDGIILMNQAHPVLMNESNEPTSVPIIVTMHS